MCHYAQEDNNMSNDRLTAEEIIISNDGDCKLYAGLKWSDGLVTFDRDKQGPIELSGSVGLLLKHQSQESARLVLMHAAAHLWHTHNVGGRLAIEDMAALDLMGEAYCNEHDCTSGDHSYTAHSGRDDEGIM